MDDIVNIIINNPTYSKGDKLLKLYAVVMLNYRQPIADIAWNEINKLFGDRSLTSTFAFLCGFLTAMDNFESARFEKFIKPDLEEEQRRGKL